MMNGCFIILVKENDRKRFFAFYDGYVRDMTKGLGDIYSGSEFDKIYHDLINNGYKEV